jgi:ATP synthase protein I
MNKKPVNYKDIGWASSLGLTLVFSTVIGFVIGIGLDKLFNTSPIFTLTFLVLGIVSGFYTIIKETIARNK